jgi:hypothetical protein
MDNQNHNDKNEDIDEYADEEDDVKYHISKTNEGLEIYFFETFDELIDIIPQNISIIILPNNYNKPIDNLPNQVEKIFFGNSFNQPIDNLPNSVKFLSFGANFNQSIDCLVDSVEEIRISQFYDQKINKLPKSLKIFNVVMMENIINLNNFTQTIRRKPIDNYYEKYTDLENKYPNAQFFY